MWIETGIVLTNHCVMNLNKVTLIGNLTGDPKLTKLPSGQAVTTFGVATNYRWRDTRTKKSKETVEFHNVVAWRRLGDIVAKYLKKGDRVFLEGRLQTKKWTAKDGTARSRVEVIADQLIMLGKSSLRKESDKTNAELAPESVNIDDVPVES